MCKAWDAVWAFKVSDLVEEGRKASGPAKGAGSLTWWDVEVEGGENGVVYGEGRRAGTLPRDTAHLLLAPSVGDPEPHKRASRRGRS